MNTIQILQQYAELRDEAERKNREADEYYAEHYTTAGTLKDESNGATTALAHLWPQRIEAHAVEPIGWDDETGEPIFPQVEARAAEPEKTPRQKTVAFAKALLANDDLVINPHAEALHHWVVDTSVGHELTKRRELARKATAAFAHFAERHADRIRRHEEAQRMDALKAALDGDDPQALRSALESVGLITPDQPVTAMTTDDLPTSTEAHLVSTTTRLADGSVGRRAPVVGR